MFYHKQIGLSTTNNRICTGAHGLGVSRLSLGQLTVLFDIEIRAFFSSIMNRMMWNELMKVLGLGSWKKIYWGLHISENA